MEAAEQPNGDVFIALHTVSLNFDVFEHSK
jgi:hypothetical protein